MPFIQLLCQTQKHETICRISFGEQARKLLATLVWNYELLAHSLTGVKCRATNVAKKLSWRAQNVLASYSYCCLSWWLCKCLVWQNMFTHPKWVFTVQGRKLSRTVDFFVGCLHLSRPLDCCLAVISFSCMTSNMSKEARSNAIRISLKIFEPKVCLAST